MSVPQVWDDEVEIRALMVEYMAACDAHDANRVAALFHVDARWEAPGTEEVLQGREAVRATYAVDCARLSFCVHFLTNEHLEIDGNVARARWSYFEPATNRNALAVWTGGRYDNELRRQDGVWLFSVFRVRGVLAAPFDTGWVPNAKVALL